MCTFLELWKKFVYAFSDCKIQFVPQSFIKDAIRILSILF